jgi:predicted PolB exonuclease-like 3'-5' exonuclease
LDVETSLSEPWTELDAAGKPTFPALPLHVPEIVCWLVSTDGRDLELHCWDRTEMPEAKGLALLSATLREANRLVTYNGRGFDMPLLSLRALAAGIDWSWWESRRARYPSWKTPLWHVDLFDQLSEYGAARGLSLDRVSRLCGLAGKVDMHGSEVDAALKRGERARVRDYCARDVFLTFVLYLRWCASHGGVKTGDAERDATAWARGQRWLSQFFAEAAA